MAAATEIYLPTSAILNNRFVPGASMPGGVDITKKHAEHGPPSNQESEEKKDDDDQSPPDVDMQEAIRLAAIFKAALIALEPVMATFDPSAAYMAADILALPLGTVRVPDAAHDLPRRRSKGGGGGRARMAAAVAGLLYPAPAGSLAPLIRYEGARVRVRAWAALQRRFDVLIATGRGRGRERGGSEGAGAAWAARVRAQGVPDAGALSALGVRALPMPVRVTEAGALAPVLGHLAGGGTWRPRGEGEGLGEKLEGGRGEPYYGTRGVEFEKGVVYEDGRVDLCKMAVGPDHVGALMESLRPNQFVRRFLLGNNIVGPVGAREIARFIRDLPDRMDTWYLAGNCIDGASFGLLVDAMVTSEAVTNVWLKRNPLGRHAAYDVFRLITQAKNIRTLDLDQTELGDAGAAELFTRLAEHAPPEGTKLALENIYLNGDGVSSAACKALASFLEKPHCGLTSIYLSCNPIGDQGMALLAPALRRASCLTRLLLQSTAISSQGAITVCDALKDHPTLSALDLGQAFATQDLGQAYNYIEDDAVPSIIKLISTSRSLTYLNLGHCAITASSLRTIASAVAAAPAASSSLLFYQAQSILPDAGADTDADADAAAAQPTFTPARAGSQRTGDVAARPGPPREEQAVRAAVRARLGRNVAARYGCGADTGTYDGFVAAERRWLVNDQRDVRKIDSVYRNREAGLARRGGGGLVKVWDAGDDTLHRVAGAVLGPVCAMRKG